MNAEADRTPTAQGGRRRTAARLGAVQALYQIELAGAAPETVIAEFLRHRLGQEEDEGESFGAADRLFFAELVRGAAGRQTDLDRMITAALTPDWPLARLEAVLRAVLRLGAYELLAEAEVPATVVISEYLDVAHAFFAPSATDPP